MHDLYPKFVEPALFPLAAYVVALIASWYGRKKYGEDGGLLDGARTVVGYYFFCSYFSAWHQEISVAWNKYPNLTARTFLVLVPVIAFLLIPRSVRLIFARPASPKDGQGA